MYDTVNFRLDREGAGQTDFLCETSNHIKITGEHLFNGEPVLTGTLDNLKVTINQNSVKVGGGSLCKFVLGDNIQTAGRKETEQAIQKISDTLHLPFDRAEVTRMDLAQNFIMRNQLTVYFSHLGNAQYYTRFEQPDSLYYMNGKRDLVFYNKVKEVTAKREPVPEIYKGRNALRFEMRFKKRLREQFKRSKVSADLLYKEKFYMLLLDKYYSEYKAIQKINMMETDFKRVKTRRDLYQIGLMALIQKEGGILAMEQKINELAQAGKITKKQVYDLRQAVREACNNEVVTVKSEAMQELDQKVKEAIRFYR